MYIELDDLKAHLNLTTDADDDLLNAQIAAASAYIAAWIVPLADADPVPEPIKEATRKLASDFYEARGSSDNQPSIPVSFDVFYLILPYRAWTF